MTTPQNGETHSNNLLAVVTNFLSVSELFVGLALKNRTKVLVGIATFEETLKK